MNKLTNEYTTRNAANEPLILLYSARVRVLLYVIHKRKYYVNKYMREVLKEPLLECRSMPSGVKDAASESQGCFPVRLNSDPASLVVFGNKRATNTASWKS